MRLQTILILSVGLNVALGVYVLSKGPAKPVPEAEMLEPSPTVKPAMNPKAERTPIEPRVLSELEAIGWEGIESDDYREYIENLRAIQCPEETIRDIIIADVNKLYAGRIAALYPPAKDFTWWVSRDRQGHRRGSAGEEDRERDKQVEALEEEKQTVIKELLGVGMAKVMDGWKGKPDEEDWRYGFLTTETRDQLKSMRERFEEQERALWGQRDELGDDAMRARFVELRRERDAEMKELLTPEQYDEYQLRNSGTARGMRDRLASFQPSKEEFAEIFKLQNSYDKEYGWRRGGDEAFQEARSQAREELQEAIKGTLGTERFDEYQLAQDERYRDTYDFTERNDLPKETAKTLYDFRKIAEEQRREVMGNENIAQEDKQAVLAALAEETRNTVQSTLGEDAFNSYQRRSGRWMEALESTRDRRRGDWGRRGR